MAAALVPTVNSQAVSRYDQAEVVNTIRQTVARGASDAQLRMFLEVCKRTGLDPFLKEVYFVAEKGLIMAARDGYLRVANEHPAFDGMETRVERDENKVPIKATCTVWRKDRNHPIVCEAWYSEYAKQSPVWRQYPSAMISKVAEVLALKRSFSINGVVTEEEISEEPRGSVEAAQAVAERKLREIAAAPPQPAVASCESLPEYEYLEEPAPPEQEEPPSDLEDELRESIIQVEQMKGRKPERGPDYYAMLEEFGRLKSRYKSIGFERTYYAILGQYGVMHSNEFPADDDGLSMARCAYKEMSLDVANREAKAKGRKK